MNLEIVTNNLEETVELGRQIGAKLKGGEVIELISDLGGGKTALTTGIVEGTGSEDAAASPSFTISYLYSAPKFNIHHFDFYRLDDPGVVKLSLAEAISEKNDVIIIEWGDIVADALPVSRIIIKLNTMEGNQDARKITIEIPQELSYVVAPLSIWRGAGGEVK